MVKRQIILTVIAFFASNSMAQTTLDLYDGDGTKLGTLVSVPDPDGAIMHMTTDDGYLVKFDPGSGCRYVRPYGTVYSK